MSRLQILLGTYRLYDTLWLPAVSISGIGGRGWEWVVETVEPIRGLEIKTIPRELARTDLKFTICRQHADHAAAILWLMTSPMEIQRGGQVQLIAAPETGPSTTFYLTQGALERVGTPAIVGARTWQTYSLIGGRWLTRLPAS